MLRQGLEETNAFSKLGAGLNVLISSVNKTIKQETNKKLGQKKFYCIFSYHNPFVVCRSKKWKGKKKKKSLLIQLKELFGVGKYITVTRNH